MKENLPTFYFLLVITRCPLNSPHLYFLNTYKHVHELSKKIILAALQNLASSPKNLIRRRVNVSSFVGHLFLKCLVREKQWSMSRVRPPFSLSWSHKRTRKHMYIFLFVQRLSEMTLANCIEYTSIQNLKLCTESSFSYNHLNNTFCIDSSLLYFFVINVHLA